MPRARSSRALQVFDAVENGTVELGNTAIDDDWGEIPP
jgi:TRAP-type mannitol/chloroaromatic compound transport system substrate-binding protein